MSLASILVILKVITSISPLKISISILALSLITSLLVFNSTLSSWVAFILVLTFSSGIIILFIYVSSLSPNENTNTNNSALPLVAPVILLILWPSYIPQTINSSINTFSSQTALVVIMVILLLTIIAIANSTFNPQQSTSSSF